MPVLHPTPAPVRRRVTRSSHRARNGTGLALAAALAAGAPSNEARAQESVALEELSVASVGTGAPSSTTTASGTIGLIGPTPGYGAGRAVSSTKTDTPQLDVPQVVTVAPREAITDLAATRVDRVFNYLPGVAQQNNFGGLSIFSYAIRGVTTSEIYQNGFPLTAARRPRPTRRTSSVSRF